MKTLYLDLNSGISGDMFIAALIDLGVDAGQLERELKKLRLDGYHLHASRGRKASLEGVKFDVHLASDHHQEEHARAHAHGHTHSHSHAHPHEHGRTFAQIRELITESQLADWVKQKAVAVFQRIAVAEGKIHGLPPDQVSFHEVGAVDSIVDITGACIALEMLGQPRVIASPVVEGTG
jgi:pyridinium-3,5-bisthiocarboxylic acid mononucleotide nickel chelatase